MTSVIVRPSPGWEFECSGCGEMLDGFDSEFEAEQAAREHECEEDK